MVLGCPEILKMPLKVRKTFPVMKDALSKPFSVGDVIAYATSESSIIRMNFGIVTNFKATMKWGKQDWQLKFDPMRPDPNFRTNPGKLIRKRYDTRML